MNICGDKRLCCATLFARRIFRARACETKIDFVLVFCVCVINHIFCVSVCFFEAEVTRLLDFSFCFDLFQQEGMFSSSYLFSFFPRFRVVRDVLFIFMR